MNPQSETKTLKLERTMNAPAERIYKAFLDPEIASKFMSPEGATTRYEKLDDTVGGEYAYTMSGEAFPEGQRFKGTFLELTEFTKIRYTYAFDTDNPGLQADMEVRITLEETNGRTKLTFEQIGIPPMIPPEMAAAGYKEMLDLLQQWVENAG